LVEYDALVVATGLQVNFGANEGLPKALADLSAECQVSTRTRRATRPGRISMHSAQDARSSPSLKASSSAREVNTYSILLPTSPFFLRFQTAQPLTFGCYIHCSAAKDHVDGLGSVS
jgi:hypothetical protein